MENNILYANRPWANCLLANRPCTINGMPMRVFYYFPIKKNPIINAFNRKITFNTSLRSHCIKINDNSKI